jgi:hypothetical protein
MHRRTLTLTGGERAELERVRDRDPRPYLREKAAALLKVADGMPALTVARSGLLKPRHPETILIWLNDYEQTRTLRPRPACRTRPSPPGTNLSRTGTGAEPAATLP